MHPKFFDFGAPLSHHLHLEDAAAARVGRIGKSEPYYFPMNSLKPHMEKLPQAQKQIWPALGWTTARGP